MSIESGVAQRACEGETVCGDGYTIDRVPGAAVVSVIDGLGHGPGAELATRAFVSMLAEDPDLPPLALMELACTRLAGTRGAAAALLRLDLEQRRAEFVGVGNIHMHAVADAKMNAVCMPGVVGRRVRKLSPFAFDLPPRALIALCSDGVSTRMELEEFQHLTPQAAAEAILDRYGKSYDDVTCVVIRYTHDG